MRIAMVGSRGIPAGGGGVERVVEELTRELAARGHEVLVFGRRGYLRGRAAPEAGQVILTPYLPGKHLEAATHTATAMLHLLSRRVDVVHVHSPGPAIWSWIPALAGLPVVLTVHAADWRRQKWSPPARAAIAAGLRIGMRLSAAVTAVSPALAEELTARFGRQVIHVPNAVRPADACPPRQIARWGLKADGYVLYVGRVVPEKRLHVLLSAWSRHRPPVPLVVVGDADESSYGRQCRRKAGSDVLMLGPRYGQVLAELYGNAAMLVQPSVLEGMSLVLLEAAAYGRCVLAADTPENRQALGDAAAYFRPDDAGELGREICRILQQREYRAAMGASARRRVLAGPSWADVAARMESIYLRAWGGGRD